MKTLTAIFAVAALTLTAGLAQARDLGPDDAVKLRDAGTVMPFEKTQRGGTRSASRWYKRIH